MMKRLTRWIVSKVIRDHENTENLKVRGRYGALEGWSSIIINIFLFAVKGGIGVMIGSIALIADAAHTIGDCITSIVVIIGFNICQKPSDKEHPFGHGRMESIATIIIAVLLVVVGFEFFRSSLVRLIHPSHVEAGPLVVVILVGTILVKEALTQFAWHLSVMIESKTLEADFWHHRSDVIATGLVVLALVASDFGFVRLDAIGGVGVSLIIMYMGYVIGRDAISPLLGAPPTPDLLKAIEVTAKSVDGVEGIHDVIAHHYGLTTLVSLHIEVHDDERPVKLHEISEDVETRVGDKVRGTAVVHVDPLNKNHSRYGEIHSAIKEMVSKDERVTSFHDLRIVGRGKATKVIFDITVKGETDEADVHDIKRLLTDRFQEKFPSFRVVIKVEPKYSYNV